MDRSLRLVSITFAVVLVSCASSPPPGVVVLPQDPAGAAGATPTASTPTGTQNGAPATPPPSATVASTQPPPAPPPPAPPPDPSAVPAPPDVAAPPATAQRTPSGLATLVLRPGTGAARPGPASTVVAHYTGWTTDGRMFDSSRTRGTPFTAPVGGVIPGFAEGLQLMVEGEQRRLWIPQDLAYRGRPGMPAGMLVFDVELIRIQP